MAKQAVRNLKPKPPKWSAETQAEVGQFFGVTQQSVSAWMTAGCPAARPYDLSAIAQWCRQRADEDAAAKPGDEKSPALERWRLARAEGAEYDTAKKKGTLVLRADAESAMDAGVSAFTGGCQVLRDGLASAFPDREAEIVRRFDETMGRVRSALVVEGSAATAGPEEAEGDDDAG